jgi:hypothetical protein
MSGKIKANPRYEVISFRTTKEQRDILDKVRGQYSISEFVDLLLTLYLQEHSNDKTCVGSKICAA